MGFWGALGKIGGLVGGAVAAPFTGGASLLPSILGGVSSVADVASGAAKGSADQRMSQDALNAKIYQALVDGELGKTQLELAQKKFELEAPTQRTNAVAKADLLRNVGDFSMGGPAGSDVTGPARASAWSATGGLRPSALGGDTRQAADLLAAMNLAKLKSGEGLTPASLPKAPTLSKPGFLENILGGVGLGGSILKGVGYKPPISRRPMDERVLADIVNTPQIG